MHHGPSDAFFDKVLQAIVPQPGPQWMTGKPLPEAGVLPSLDELGGEEHRWRKLLLALTYYREELATLARSATDDARTSYVATHVHDEPAPGPLASAGRQERARRQELAMRAVRRSVWLNLGPAREVLIELPGATTHKEFQAAAKGGLYPKASGGDPCTDMQGLASAIHAAWTAACDPEELWAAQALLGECQQQVSMSTTSPVDPQA